MTKEELNSIAWLSLIEYTVRNEIDINRTVAWKTLHFINNNSIIENSCIL